MPIVYFKTKTLNNYQFPDGSSDRYYIELLLDEITSCLNANAIRYEILSSDKNMMLNTKNEEYIIINFEMSNDESDNLEKNKGIKIIFTEGNPMSKRMSDILLNNIKRISNEDLNLEILSETTNPELQNINQITVVFENLLNSNTIEWLRQNIDEIANQFIMSLTEYFGLPFVPCSDLNIGVVRKDESLRLRPNLNSEIVGSVTGNTKINVLGQWEDWYIVEQNNNLGYIQTKFIEI